MKTVTVKIKPDASVEVEANGFVGSQCIEYTKPLLDKLSGEIKQEVVKPEFFEANDNNVLTTSTFDSPDDAA